MRGNVPGTTWKSDEKIFFRFMPDFSIFASKSCDKKFSKYKRNTKQGVKIHTKRMVRFCATGKNGTKRRKKVMFFRKMFRSL